MNVKISVLVICVKVIIYLLLHNLHDCTFNVFMELRKINYMKKIGFFSIDIKGE